MYMQCLREWSTCVHLLYSTSFSLERDIHYLCFTWLWCIYLPAVYGERYLWNLPILTVEQGDEVDWSWEPPEYISGVSYRVEQTANATASTYDGSGFRSGKVSTPKGGFLGYHLNRQIRGINPIDMYTWAHTATNGYLYPSAKLD